MTTKDKLDTIFINQSFAGNEHLSDDFSHYCRIAEMYAEIENSIAGVSDLKSRVGYICYGKIAEYLKIGSKGDCHKVDSIWEDEVFSLILPEDVEKRHVDELRFIHFLKNVPVYHRKDYYLNVSLRVKEKYGHHLVMRHRDFCLGYLSNGSFRYMLALYSLTNGGNGPSTIVNSITGESMAIMQHDCQDILTNREKQILRMINDGVISKEIAQRLDISINTVNTHRQNILANISVPLKWDELNN